ncbi:hypothetical protein D3C84_1212490 [compost metagenome]
MVERLAGKSLPHLDPARDDRQFQRIEALIDQLRQQRGGTRNDLRWLEHHPVAGGEGTGQRAE